MITRIQMQVQNEFKYFKNVGYGSMAILWNTAQGRHCGDRKN